jgi:hypothetical protein
MTTIEVSVRELSARLPELAWKLSTLYKEFNPKSLPRGLFQSQFEMTPTSCIDEIHADLHLLNHHKNDRSSRYLADRVNQKINVLVRLCQLHKDKKSIKQAPAFGVQSLSTRQQWLGTLQEEIDGLSSHRQALITTLNRLQTGQDSAAILSVQADLGDIERRLTLARETLTRATA